MAARRGGTAVVLALGLLLPVLLPVLAPTLATPANAASPLFDACCPGATGASPATRPAARAGDQPRCAAECDAGAAACTWPDEATDRALTPPSGEAPLEPCDDGCAACTCCASAGSAAVQRHPAPPADVPTRLAIGAATAAPAGEPRTLLHVPLG